jgi:peptide/nickel transport system permease protein
VVLMLAAAIFAPLLTPYDPIVGDISRSLEPPSAAHWLGTDDQGRDVLTRVLYGARVSLLVASIAVVIGMTVGTSIGLAAGYCGGAIDLTLMRLIDALLAFPGLLLAISITAALGPQIQNAMIAIGIVGKRLRAANPQPGAQLARAQYVTAARRLARSRRSRCGLLPNMTNTLIVQITLTPRSPFCRKPFCRSGSVRSLRPSWGRDISYNQGYLANLRWWGAPGFRDLPGGVRLQFLGDALRII